MNNRQERRLSIQTGEKIKLILGVTRKGFTKRRAEDNNYVHDREGIHLEL